jgi:ribosomal protein S18 acetylase RimI-like enzyme
MRIAGAAMIGYGIKPDFAGLDSDLGALGSNSKACMELVATMDGVVVGVAILTYSDDTAGKLTGYYVDPKWRGQGIGSALLVKATGGLPVPAERLASRDCILRRGIS